jgi:thiamine pyridinylase
MTAVAGCLLGGALATWIPHASADPARTARHAEAPATAPGAASARASGTPGGAVALTVALFPWVPRLGQLEDVIAAAWHRRHPDVPLTFILWDCYAADPPPGLDVFVFDAVFLDRFVQRGLVQPIAPDEIEDAADLLPYALDAARSHAAGGAVAAGPSGAGDGVLYGVPQLGCTSLLFYRRGDAALDAAADLGDVVRALGTGTYTGLKPPRHTGLLVDLSDPTGDGCLYVDALEDTYGVYTADPPLAWTAGMLDPWALSNVRDLRRMASRTEAGYRSTDQFLRARWFGRGLGRAFVGFAENLSAMGEAGRVAVAFKLLPLSVRGDVSLFYADLAGVSPSVGRGAKRALALELANLVASGEVLTEALGPSRTDASPQYVFSVRRSVYKALAPRFPLYARMYELIGGEGAEPRPFRLGADARHWLRAMGPVVKRQVFAAQ